MLELIRTELTARGHGHLLLTGQTENRQALVDKFQTGPAIPIFFLSLKAAGSGLNLTAASYVVLFDPWWNPAVEAQAIDRTHRIGQKSQVIAYRLIARNTVEEKICALQREKPPSPPPWCRKTPSPPSSTSTASARSWRRLRPRVATPAPPRHSLAKREPFRLPAGFVGKAGLPWP